MSASFPIIWRMSVELLFSRVEPRITLHPVGGKVLSRTFSGLSECSAHEKHAIDTTEQS